jgi:hypothetical protein
VPIVGRALWDARKRLGIVFTLKLLVMSTALSL